MAAAVAAPRRCATTTPAPTTSTCGPGSCGTPGLVAFDWQMMGPGSIGSDLGQLLCYLPAARDSASTGAEEDPETAALRAHQEEPAVAGVELNPHTVRPAYVAEGEGRRTC